MADRVVRKGDRFRWWLSDRSGFQFGFQPLTSPPNAYTRESGRPIRDNGIQVNPDEYDQPPPSNKPLGGEGEIGTGARADSGFQTDSNFYLVPPESLIPIVQVNSSTTIAWSNEPVVYIVGRLVPQVMAVSPQIQSAPDKQTIVLMGVGSSVTLLNGSGLSLHTGQFVMGSGYLLNLIYTQTDSLWHETSRGILNGDLGSL